MKKTAYSTAIWLHLTYPDYIKLALIICMKIEEIPGCAATSPSPWIKFFGISIQLEVDPAGK